MKQADLFCIEHMGKTSLQLMEAAAAAVKEAIPEECVNILVLVGAGNNGADGLAAARLFLQERTEQKVSAAEQPGSAEGTTEAAVTGTEYAAVTVVECIDPAKHRCTEEYRQQKEWLWKMPGVTWTSLEEFRNSLRTHGDGLPYDCIIDGVFGVGLTRSPEQMLSECFSGLNKLRKVSEAFPYVIAVDVPSGVNGDNGAVPGTALRADCTVTFGWMKIGLICYPGAEYAGKVTVADIGYPEGLLERVFGADILPGEAVPCTAAGRTASGAVWTDSVNEEENPYAYTITGDAVLPKRGHDTHKGSYGKLLIIAGCRNMAGAAYFSGAAAYASGTGLVRLMTPDENRVIIQTLLPEAVLCTYDESSALECLKEHMAWADHILLGPGLGMSAAAEELTEYVIKKHSVPLLVDADGLNILAKHPEWYAYLTEEDVLTPHPAELARLLRASEGVREVTGPGMISAGRRLNQLTGAVCVCKSARTLVFTGSCSFYINSSGNDGMATAGMGDVLAGIIAGFMAGGMSSGESAINGVYLHGAIGDGGTQRFSAYALTAGKMITVYREILEGGGSSPGIV